METIGAKINEFLNEMVEIGYAEGEAKALFYDFIGDRNLNALTKNELNDLAEQLNDYLSFARKCKKIV